MMKIIKIKDYYGRYTEVTVTDEFADEWRLLENESQRVYRKEVYHRTGTPLDDLNLFAGPESDPESAMIHREQMERVYAAIDELTPLMRSRLLKYAENRNFEEISREEHCSSANIKKSIYAAIRNIHMLLGE